MTFVFILISPDSLQKKLEHPPAPFKGGIRLFSHSTTLSIFNFLQLLSCDFYLLSYSSLILNFRTLIPIITIVMAIRMRVSFHIYANPVPLIIMFLIIMMKYLGGIIMVT
jgi:hypothetical protein